MELEELKKELIKMCVHEYAVSILDFESEIEDMPRSILNLLGLSSKDIKEDIKNEVIRVGLQYYSEEELEEIIKSYPGVI